MSDEFDDVPDPAVAAAVPSPAAVHGRAPRLLARLYGSANHVLRSRLVVCLVRPLGPLALASVAAGAFTALLSRSAAGGRFSTKSASSLMNAAARVARSGVSRPRSAGTAALGRCW